MKYSVRMADAVHLLAYIEMFQGTDLSSETIAKSIETHAANVRKLMSQLRKSDLILTINGKASPSLARPPKEISLYDIYTSVQGDEPLLRVDNKTNPACVIGGNIQSVLTEQYAILQHVVDDKMKTITLDEIIHKISQEEVLKRPDSRKIVEKFL